MTIGGISRDAFTQKGLDAEGLKGVLALASQSAMKGDASSRLKFITHADNPTISKLDHKPLLMKDASTGKADKAWFLAMSSFGKTSNELMSNVHIGGFRAHFDANGAGDTLHVEIDKSHGLGTMRNDKSEDESSHTWNKAMDESAGKIVDLFKNHYPDKQLAFKVMSGSGMDDLVSLLNVKAGNQIQKAVI